MDIAYLADHPEHIPILAGWFQEEWGDLAPGRKLEERIKLLREKANRCAVPVSFVAIEHGEPVGSASLVECDMASHDHLTPWLSSVYVTPPCRKQGIGTALINRVSNESKQQGFPKLYLWTPKAEMFYARRGWQVLERTEYKNKNAVVMFLPLQSTIH
jgi:N-acetylglutamate synthase-like GNAT family acetyltransferase